MVGWTFRKNFHFIIIFCFVTEYLYHVAEALLAVPFYLAFTSLEGLLPAYTFIAVCVTVSLSFCQAEQLYFQKSPSTFFTTNGKTRVTIYTPFAKNNRAVCVGFHHCCNGVFGLNEGHRTVTSFRFPELTAQ